MTILLASIASVSLIVGGIGIMNIMLVSPPTRPRTSIQSMRCASNNREGEKEQLLVKRPTEVTQVMRVNGQTQYYDRVEKPIGLIDLRAGDTVYIVSSPSSGFALEVREGPMTVAELHRRYLPKQR